MGKRQASTPKARCTGSAAASSPRASEASDSKETGPFRKVKKRRKNPQPVNVADQVVMELCTEPAEVQAADQSVPGDPNPAEEAKIEEAPDAFRPTEANAKAGLPGSCSVSPVHSAHTASLDSPTAGASKPSPARGTNTPLPHAGLTSPLCNTSPELPSAAESHPLSIPDPVEGICRARNQQLPGPVSPQLSSRLTSSPAFRKPADYAGAGTKAAPRKKGAGKRPNPGASRTVITDVSHPKDSKTIEESGQPNPEAAPKAAPEAVQRFKFGKKVRDAEEPDPEEETPRELAPAVSYRAAALIKWGTAGSDPLLDAHSLISDRLLRHSSPAATAMHVRPQLQEVADDMERSMEALITNSGGGNSSFLLFGQHGSGRLLVTERAVAAVQRRHNTTAENPVVGCVRLRGSVHTDERGVFREIARQLCSEFKLDYLRSASQDENIRFLEKLMTDLSRSHKLVIFVLEDFDQFAQQSCKRQVVLYNILDFINTPGVQAVLIGTTSVYNAVDALEKRVLSRFSLHTVKVTLPELRQERRGGRSTAPATLCDMLMLPPAGSGATSHHDTFAATWNDALILAVEHSDTVSALARAFQGGNMMTSANPGVSPGALTGIAIRVIDDVDDAMISHRSLVRAIRATDVMTGLQAQAVADLSVGEAFVAVAALRIDSRHKSHDESFNFVEVWEELETLQQLHPHPDHHPRHYMWRSFETLLSLRLLLWRHPRVERQGALREFLPVQLAVDAAAIKRGLVLNPFAPGLLRQWADKLVVANTSLIL